VQGFAEPAGLPPGLRADLAPFSRSAIAEYLLEHLGLDTVARSVRVELTYEHGSLRRLDAHLTLKGAEALAGAGSLLAGVAAGGR
jgi:hypothetical protein